MNKSGNTFKCALFDLDGVVFDTEAQYSFFWGNVFKRYYPESKGLEQKIKGMTLVQIYERYFKDNIEQQHEITKAADAFEQTMEYRFIPGFESFVADLRKHGVKTAVVTSSNQMKMQSVYNKHGLMKDMFDAILTSEDFERSKPDPDCYLKGAQRFELHTDECVVFEDSFNGLKSGKSACMFVVGLATTNPAEAISPYADVVVSDFQEMTFDGVCEMKNNKNN